MSTSTKKILLVEDDLDIIQILSMRLEINGFDVITATDGELGLEKAKEQKPDLILLDLMLPKINGYEVCQMLKFDDDHKDIPIVITSSLHMESERTRAIEAGADAYFLKPVDLELLLVKMKSLMNEN